MGSRQLRIGRVYRHLAILRESWRQLRSQVPISSIKGEVKKKHTSFGWNFSCFAAPPDRAKSVLTDRAMCSVVGQGSPVVWIFSTSGFHRFFATKPISSETSKAERWSNLATIVLLGTRGP